MNRILITARKVRGADEAELARLLGIASSEYQAIESGRLRLEPEHARKLGSYYLVPSWYFLDAAASPDIEARIGLLRQQLDMLLKPEYRALPTPGSVALTTTIIELMIAKDELAAALLRELSLTEELAVITRMFEHIDALTPAGSPSSPL
jgi:transcriptional regulator with XRE-family HTH domain